MEHHPILYQIIFWYVIIAIIGSPISLGFAEEIGWIKRVSAPLSEFTFRSKVNLIGATILIQIFVPMIFCPIAFVILIFLGILWAGELLLEAKGAIKSKKQIAT